MSVDTVKHRLKQHMYVFQEPHARTTISMHRAGNSLHISIRREDKIEKFSIRVPGGPEHDRLIGFLLLAITGGTGNFRFNTFETSSLKHVKRELERKRPELVSNDPADAFITEALALHVPTPYILPAGRDYITSIARSVRAASGLVDLDSLARTAVSRNELYSVLERAIMRGAEELGLPVGSPVETGSTFRALALRALHEHYPLLGKVKYRPVYRMFEDFTRIFPNEHLLYLVSHLDYLNVLLRKLVYRNFHGMLDLRFESAGDGTYKAVIRMSKPGRPTVEAGIGLEASELLSLFLPFPNGKPGDVIVKRLLDTAVKNGIASWLDTKLDFILIAEPGRAIVVDLPGRDYTVFESFQSLRELPEYYPIGRDRMLRVLYGALERLGDEFYGSRELREAVAVTGCLLCDEYVYLAERVALTRNGDTWALSYLEEKDGNLHAHIYWADTPREAILNGLDRILTLESRKMEKIGRYAPEVLRLRRLMEELRGALGATSIFFVPEYDMVWVRIAGLRAVWERDGKHTVRPVSTVYIFRDELVPDERRLEHVDKHTRWVSLLPLEPGFEETLSSLGYERVPRRRKHLVFKDGDVYVALRRK